MAQIQSALIVGKKESISDQLLLLNPYQIPVLSLIGYGPAVTQTNHHWIEDKLNAMNSNANGSVLIGGTALIVDDVTLFRPDQVIAIGEELLLVTAVATSTSTLTVTRAYGDTTAAAIADNALIEIMFNIKDEGSDARDSQYKPRTDLDNITQIFDDTVKISGTAQATAQYGITDLYLYERMKVQDRLALELENALVNGKKFQAGDRRMMGGIRQFIKTNIFDASAADITFKMIDDMMLKIYVSGATKDATKHVLMVSPIQRQKLGLADDNKVRIGQDTAVLGRVVDTVVTNYGTLPLITNVNFKADEAMILDANRMGVLPLQGRQFSHTYLGATGDNVKGQIIGEYTLEFRQEAAHARFKNLKVN